MPRHPELWCSPPDWTTAQSSPRHHCGHTASKTNPACRRSIFDLTKINGLDYCCPQMQEEEDSSWESSPHTTSLHRADLRRVLESDVPPLWRSDTGREGACQSLHRQLSRNNKKYSETILPIRVTKMKSQPRELTLSFLGFGHQLVVFLKGQQHVFPLCIVLKHKPLCVKALLSSSTATASQHQHTSHEGSVMAVHHFTASAVQGLMVSVLPW